MITKKAARRARACSMLVLGVAVAPAVGPARAQTSQPTPAPTPAPSPALVPGLEHFSLPPSGGSAVPRPAASQPVAPPVVRTLPAPTPSPARSPRPAAPVPTPTSAPTRAPAPAGTPAAQPQPLAPAPTALPTAVPTPVPTDTPTAEPLSQPVVPPVVLPPMPEPSSEPSPAAPDIDRGYRLEGWQAYAAIGGGAAALFLLGWLTFLWLRRREEIVDEPAAERHANTVFDLGAADAPPSLPPRPAAPVSPAPQRHEPPPAAPSPSAAPAESPPVTHQDVAARARLDIELKPKRAGTNLLSAAVEYQILITNAGDAPARLVTTDVRILTAGPEQDAVLQAVFAAPIEKPVTAPFDVAPGETATLDGMAMMPREMLNVMTVEGRALFVPVLAINLRYEWESGTGQTASSFVIGIDRGEGAKLAPFRVDGPPRMHGNVAQLAYTVSVRR
jgi:hypothetical protein